MKNLVSLLITLIILIKILYLARSQIKKLLLLWGTRTFPLNGMKFKYIRPGAYIMGSNIYEWHRWEEEVEHRVCITKGFYMQISQVTQGQWLSVMGNNPSYFSNGGDDYPVENVSWEDVQDFINRLNVKGFGKFRLPTEAEWEYACRAGSQKEIYDKIDNVAWYDGNSEGSTHRVMTKKPNAWGLYDMMGNVFEWCADYHGPYPNESVIDPIGPSKGESRILRGGSFKVPGSCCRSADRFSKEPYIKDKSYGFRLICDK